MPKFQVEIDKSLSAPPYQQIREQIADHINSGTLVTGEKLPSIRSLASYLGVAPRTVARSYSELEESGMITSRPRLGSQVAGTNEAATASSTAASAFIEKARLSGMSLEEALHMIDSLWEP